MYGWLYRIIPGPWWVKVLVLLVLFAALVVVLFGWVFPVIAPYMPFNDATIEGRAFHATAHAAVDTIIPGADL